jgi:hypothetical protein
VLHKEARGLQHHGVDLVGYEVDGDLVTLVLVEIMASVAAGHPPSTVRQHRDQLLVETLRPVPPERLLDDLSLIHDECGSEAEKTIINGLIVAVADGSLAASGPQAAVAVLIRPLEMFDASDWRPFQEATGDFEAASIPANVDFAAVECDQTLTDLMDRVKIVAGGP